VKRGSLTQVSLQAQQEDDDQEQEKLVWSVAAVGLAAVGAMAVSALSAKTGGKVGSKNHIHPQRQ
jgi:hypothetical protein